MPVTAITARSKRSVRPANKDAASAAVWMNLVWNGCVPIGKPNPTKKPCVSGRSGSNPCLRKGKDWHGMRRFRLRRLWRVNCEALMRSSGTKSQAPAEETWLGTASFPSRSRFCPAFGFLVVVDSSFFAVSAFSLADEITLSHEHGREHSSFLMSFARWFFNTLKKCTSYG